MKISPLTRRSLIKRSFFHGFTLIELLIVIVIISIVSSFAILTIHINQNKRLQDITNQIVNILSLAETEAMLRPATLGLIMNPHSFQFYKYQPNRDPKANQWIPLTDKILGFHPIPDDVTITLKMQNPSDSNDPSQPKLIISESNDLTPFIIFIGKKDASPLFKIIGQANGTIKSERIHAEE